MVFDVCYHKKGNDKWDNVFHTASNQIEFIQTFCNAGSVLVNSRIMPMRMGAVYIIDSAKMHCTSQLAQKEYVRNILYIDKEKFLKFVHGICAEEIFNKLFSDGYQYAMLEQSAADTVDQYFAKMQVLQEEPGTHDCDMFALLLSIILSVRDSYGEEAIVVTGIVGRAVAYINLHYQEYISASIIAEALHVNKHYLCHVFKEKTAITISIYLLRKRLSVAEKFLLTSDRKLSDIAAEVGFSSESYFCKVFKEQYGQTPRTYRKHNQKS